jgi:hypothetical protein
LITWGKKLGHTKMKKEIRVITLGATASVQFSWKLVRKIVMMISGQVRKWVTFSPWVKNWVTHPKYVKTLLTL